MTFDDFEYEDYEEYDDEEYYDDDEEEGYTSITGRSRYNPFAADDGDDDEEDDAPGASGTGLPGSSRSGANPFNSLGGSSSRAGGTYTTGPRPSSSGGDRSSSSDGPRRLGGSGSSSSYSSRSSTPSRTVGSSGSSGSGSGSGSGSSSPFGIRGSGLTGSRSSSKDDDSSDDDKKSSSFGGFRRSSDDSNKKDDSGKKDDSSGGGIGSRLGGLASKMPFGGASKDDSGKKDSGTSGGGIVSGLTSKIPFGGGSKDGGSKSSGSSGGIGSALSNMKERVSKATPSVGSLTKGGSGSGDKSGGGFMSGIRSKIPSFGKGDKSDKSSSSGRFSNSGASQSSFGANRSRSSSSSSSSKSGGGTTIGSRVKNLFSFGRNKEEKPRRQRQPRTPTVADDAGLSLDNWLDIAGVGLVFGSLVLFFSAISAEQAAISGLHRFFGQLFGWGAIAVPITMFVSGMWLIVRHFGDEAPTVDPVRIAGAVILFVSMLVIFQYLDSFSYELGPGGVITQDLLEARVQYSWEELQEGGGALGATLYLSLLTSVTELGGFFVVIFAVIIGVMLLTRLSASELVAFFVGLWRSSRDTMRHRAEVRRAERQLALQSQYEQQGPDISVSKPDVPQLGDGRQQPALPEPAGAEMLANRQIRFNRGGESFVTGENRNGQYVQGEYAQANNNNANNGSGGLFGIFRRGSSDSGGSLAGGILGMLGSGDSDDSPAGTNVGLPENPLPLDDTPAAPPASTPPAASQQQPAINPQGTQPSQTPPQQPQQPQQPAASAAAQSGNQDPLEEARSVIQSRQQRLDALRRGEIGPLSERPAKPQEPRINRTEEKNGKGGYSAFGRPDDRIKHPSEKLPYDDDEAKTPPSKLPSTQPKPGDKPYQQNLNVPPAVNPDRPAQKPQSSPVRKASATADWRLPDYRTLLSSGSEQEFDREALLRQAKIIEDTLEAFGAPGRVVEVNTGPVITQFGVEPSYISSRSGKQQRVKVGSIATLDKDLQLALGARSIRVEAPVPGKGYVGIEVPNAEATLVSLRDVMEDQSFRKHKSPLGIALGQSVSGQPISADLAEMPHLLIAGTTGSGKSVCVNAIITSILARNTPDKVKFIMVDPKRVELTGYNGIPHLVAPVVVDLERIVGVLKWVTREMDDRYKRFSNAGARNIVDFNKHVNPDDEPMPYIIVIIDELADLMMMAPEETERTITRIAALARATGIHLVIATQRPSVDVVTGLIKANFPARIAFAVAGGVDSRVILDQPGAERLLGKGDMLYLSGDSPAPLRLQGVYVSDLEITNIVRYWKTQAVNQPTAKPISILSSADRDEDRPRSSAPSATNQTSIWDEPEDDLDDLGDDVELDEATLTGDDGEDDELYDQAVELVRRLDKASISLLQRRLRIGYTRAARMIDVMEARGVVGPAKDGSSKPRDVLPA